MAAASAGMSPVAQLSHQLSGLAGIKSTKALDDSLRDSAELEAFAARLDALHQQAQAMPHQFLIVTEQEQLQGVCATSADVWNGFSGAADAASFAAQPLLEQRQELWIANTQVNFCATAYPTVPLDHPDAPALAVLGGFLRNGYLHRTIREQGGAYGGGASQDSNIGAFRFYSYRDPRLVDTLADFDAAIDWMLSTSHDAETLEQAILGVVSSLDKPSSPAGEAKQHFHNNLFGRSHALRERFRQRTLQLQLEDLQRVTDTYLRQGQASTAIITSQTSADKLGGFIEERGLSIIEL